MKTEHVGSPVESAKELAAHLTSLAEPTLPLPAEPQLRTLIETAFFASMYEEEGRKPEFGIAWQPELHECSAVIAIGNPVRATPANLAKLAPASSGVATSIAVRPAGNDLV